MSTSLIAPRHPAEASADPAADLRLLLSDLQWLVERLGLKEQSRGLSQTLKAAQDQLAGPRAVALLLAERADLKRRFLERLLGPVPELPECIDAVCRLEYGREPECVVQLPEGLTAVLPLHQVREFLERRGADLPANATRLAHLPSPALERGLAVVDTPPLAAMNAESLAPLLEQADAWLLIVAPECTLQPGTEALLRTLPDRGARLAILIEEGGAINAAAAVAARESLAKRLADCGLGEARLTPLDGGGPQAESSAVADLQASLVDRGRQRWLAQVRATIGEAFEEVESVTELEVKLAGLSLRQVRLRRGLKDLEALRLRFAELRERENAPEAATTTGTAPTAPAQTASASVEVSGMAAQPLFVRFTGSAEQSDASAERRPGWREQMRRVAGMKVRLRRRERRTDPQAPGPAASAGIADGSVFRRPYRSRAEGARKTDSDAPRVGHGWPMQVLGGGLTVGFVCLLLWAFWPHSPVRPEDGGQWNYQPPAPAAAAPEAGVPAPPDSPALELPPVEAETEPATSSSELGTRPLLKPRAASRTPLLKPRPDGLRAGASRSHHRRDLLGIGKLWHWVRRGHDRKPSDE